VNASLAERIESLFPVVWGPFPPDRDSWSERHWLFIIASWFALLDENVIIPFVESRHIVVVDNAHYKTMARYRLKKNINQELVRRVFSDLRYPDGLILLEVRPEIALARKGEFEAVESGFHGEKDEDFTRHQLELSTALRSVLTQTQPCIIETSTLSPVEILQHALLYLRGIL